MLIILLVAVTLISINYYTLIVRFYIGLKKLNTSLPADVYKPLSIIVAARNEEQNILNCLGSLARLNYPKELLEITIVNDQSTDNTGILVDSFIKEHKELNIKQRFTTDTGGKKKAIKLGITHSSHNIIVITDADCIQTSGWADEINKCFNSHETLFVAGPVMMKASSDFFSTFQCLEFNSLIASTAGSIGINKPIMCNGANMAFTRFAYEQLNTNALHDNKVSGDDVFLMLSIKEKFGANSIVFANSPNALVYTSPNLTLNQFINQRIRWVSKSNDYRDLAVIYTALSAFSYNLVIMLLLVATFFNYHLLILSGTLYLLKLAVDSLLLSRYTRTFGQRNLLWLLPITEILVIIYTVSIGIVGNILSFEWKGRNN